MLERGFVISIFFFLFPHKALSFLIIFHRINWFGQMPRHDMGMDPAASSVSFCYSLLLLKPIHHMVLGMTSHDLGYPFHLVSNKGIVQGILHSRFQLCYSQSWCPVGYRDGRERRGYKVLLVPQSLTHGGILCAPHSLLQQGA